ncbi:MAG: sulfatase [Planctomycetota bacterium]
MPQSTNRIFMQPARWLGLASILGFGWQATVPIAAADSGKPNVVFILVDDMGLHDLTVTGSQFYETPNIDRIFREGMTFTQGYATCRVCSPSRASIQLGKFPARHGITQYLGGASGTNWKRGDPLLPADYLKRLPAEDETLAEAFQHAGYATFFAGKWHLGGEGSYPEDHGFDINVGGHQRGSPPGGFFSPYKNPVLENGEPGESLTLRLADETCDFIAKQKDQPFFAMLSFYAVHAPLQTTPDLWKKYQQKWAREHSGKPQDYSRFRVDRTWPVREVQDNPIYAGMVETTDQAVGRVLKLLDETGLADNTIVCFTSDNGGVCSGDAYATSNLPLRGGKGRPHEGGIREPFAIRFPSAVPANSKSNQIATGTDWYPTLLELCGLPLRPDQHVDGVSLVPAIKGQSLPQRDLIWHYPHYDNQGGNPSSILRRGDFKLIHFYEDGHDELYRLSADPSERSDLALAHPVRTQTMAADLRSWLESVNAKIPEADPRYDPAKYEKANERRQTAGLQRLEKQHAQFLSPNFQPNPTWWGARPEGKPTDRK